MDNYQKKSSGVTIGIIVVGLIIAAVVGAFAYGLIDVDQTKETKLPQVSVQGGQTPAFDVKTADVDVGIKRETVDVPKVEVNTRKTEANVPTIDVKKAE